jgi:hypothetical protein
MDITKEMLGMESKASFPRFFERTRGGNLTNQMYGLQIWYNETYILNLEMDRKLLPNWRHFSFCHCQVCCISRKACRLLYTRPTTWQADL